MEQFNTKSTSTLALYWFLVWTCLSVLQTVRLYFAYNVYNSDIVTWQKAAIWAFSEWYIWGLLSILIINIIQWLDAKRDLKKNIVFFIGGLILVPAIHLYLYSIVWYLTKDIYYAQVMTSYTNINDIFLGSYLGKINDNSVAFFLIVAAIYAYTYYKRLYLEQQRIAQLNQQLVEAKLEHLKTQIQPHFLFNTLNTITALIHSDPHRADLMTTKLSDLLRLSLDSENKQKVILSEELSFLEKYVDIQKVRFEERMEVKYTIDEKTIKAFVPSLILQPLVENSIKHSVAHSSEKVTISIKTERINNRLIIEIVNTGKSLPEDFKEQMLERTGLQNSIARLKQLYLHDATLEIENNIPNGVIVKLSLPCQFKEDV